MLEYYPESVCWHLDAVKLFSTKNQDKMLICSTQA